MQSFHFLTSDNTVPIIFFVQQLLHMLSPYLPYFFTLCYKLSLTTSIIQFTPTMSCFVLNHLPGNFENIMLCLYAFYVTSKLLNCHFHFFTPPSRLSVPWWSFCITTHLLCCFQPYFFINLPFTVNIIAL